MSTDEAVKTLRKLRQTRRLIPFIGAGLSKPLRLPDWDGLIDMLARELGYDPEVYRLNGTKEELAEYYVARKGIGALRTKMTLQFTPPEPAIAASEVHSLLVDLKWPVIYTTNYDRIIEQAFELKRAPCHTVANLDDMAAAPEEATQVVKFHGTFDDDASLVLTESSYFDRLEFESAIDIRLRADMLGRSLLFLGYSLDDINIRYVLYRLHKLRNAAKREAARARSAYLTAFGAGEIQRTLLAQWDVEVIELDPLDKTRSLLEFLRSLS